MTTNERDYLLSFAVRLLGFSEGISEEEVNFAAADYEHAMRMLATAEAQDERIAQLERQLRTLRRTCVGIVAIAVVALVVVVLA